MKPRNFKAPDDFLRNPIWYVIIVPTLGVLAFQVDFLKWLASGVALTWGIWLIWSQFRGGEPEIYGCDVPQPSLNQAIIYKRQIRQVLQTTLHQSNQAHLQQLMGKIDVWIETIEVLGGQLAALRRDRLIDRDIVTVPQTIAGLQIALTQETNAVVRAELERALRHRKKQLASLETLRGTIKQTEFQIESTLALLGTIYSQLLTGQSTYHVADYSRLASEIDEETRCLQDQLEALREVKMVP